MINGMSIKADLSGLDKLVRAYPEASKDARVAKITEALALLESRIVPLTPYGAGPIHLRDTMHGTVHAAGRKVWGVFGTPLEHGLPVEMGTKPHFPPPGPIQHWVQKKLHIEDEKASARVAFLIARKISKKGTEGAHMFAEGFNEAESAVRAILDEIPADILRRVNR